MRKAFTLIELLVVISIIALLVAILLPALGRARQSAIDTQCLAQIKQLNLGWHTYPADNQGRLMSSETTNYQYQGSEVKRLGKLGDRWIYTPGSGNSPESIRRGALYEYMNDDLNVYMCPSDDTEREYNRPKHWSYTINLLLAGHNPGWAGWYPDRYETEDFAFTMAQITKPSEVITVGEEYDKSKGFNDGSWMIPSEGDRWMDYPIDYHPKGTTVSFADGHAEFHLWQDPRTPEISSAMQQANNNADLIWLQQFIHPRQ
ncbi:MAG: type II secretion system protein [Planctomycetota bacterium]